MGKDEDYPAGLFTHFAHRALEVEAIVLPSLTEILYDPSLKRSVWLAIQSLTENVNGNKDE